MSGPGARHTAANARGEVGGRGLLDCILVHVKRVLSTATGPASAAASTPARRLAAACLSAALLLGPAAPALGQSGAPDEETSEEQLQARLVGFPVGLGPGDDLAVTLEVLNRSSSAAEEIEVTVQIYQGVTSVSALQTTYRGRFGSLLASDTIRLDDVVVGAGEGRMIAASKPLEELSAFRNTTTDRAYPVRIVVRSSESTAEPVDTHMVYYSEPPEKPLGIGLVVPLHSPSIYTDGSQPDLVTRGSLYESVTEGRLNAILTALEQFPELPVTLAPTGLLLSMLQDMASGYATPDAQVGPDDPQAQAAASTLARLRDLAARPATQVIATSYSPTPLPALNRAGLGDLAQTQLREGRNTLLAEPVGLLRAQPLEGWLLPAGGALDQPSVDTVHRAGSTHVILAADSLRPVRQTFTRGLPARLQGGGGSATTGVTGAETIAVIADSGLADTLVPADESKAVESRQRFAAETATIHLETPGLTRAVAAVAPWDWDPGPDLAIGILATLADSVWLNPTHPQQIVSELDPPAGEGLRLGATEDVLDAWPDLPTDSYFDALERAGEAIDRYSTLSPPALQLGALSRRLLIAQSSDWWSTTRRLERAEEFAAAIPESVDGELSKIRGPGPQTITLTSNTGVIPLSIGSGLDYPVNVVLRLDSDKLRFPDGNDVNVQGLQPPNQTIRVRASTDASGTFPIKVQVLTPGGLLISDSVLTVRSTAYNIVALSITGGAALFLVGWWIVGAVRKHKRPPPVDAA
ncbi:MAG: DUF6049 family protein [Actinomycetota bacterium]